MYKHAPETFEVPTSPDGNGGNIIECETFRGYKGASHFLGENNVEQKHTASRVIIHFTAGL